MQRIEAVSRRRMLQFLSASPLFAGRAFAESPPPPDPMIWAPRDVDRLIADPKDAIDVFDFEPVMRQNVPPAHFGYMATGVDDEITLRANRAAFGKFALRPRRLVDVSKIDMTADILGTTYASPIVIAPTGSNRAFHADAEVAVAKAARAGLVSALHDAAPGDRGRADQTRRGGGRAGDRRDAGCQIGGEVDDLRAAAADRHARMRKLPRRQYVSLAKAEFCRDRSCRHDRHDRHQSDLGYDRPPAR
jgi:FMN-dependent dehydrogenase